MNVVRPKSRVSERILICVIRNEFRLEGKKRRDDFDSRSARKGQLSWFCRNVKRVWYIIPYLHVAWLSNTWCCFKTLISDLPLGRNELFACAHLYSPWSLTPVDMSSNARSESRDTFESHIHDNILLQNHKSMSRYCTERNVI